MVGGLGYTRRNMRVLADNVYSDLNDLIFRARDFLFLVSPFWDLTQRQEAELERAASRGVILLLVARGGDARKEQEIKLRSVRARIPRAQVSFVERLHAKLYLSDSEAMVTSLNLVEASAVDSIEVGVRLSKAEYPLAYQDLFKFCEKLITIGKQDQQRARNTEATESSRSRSAPPPRERVAGSRRRPAGHCIRCAESIELNSERPLCDDCYRSWAEYRNPEYEEKHCHACGNRTATSMLKPLCRSCWKRAAT